jgi:protocatechuate 3,4-dioxygenase beta subunit
MDNDDAPVGRVLSRREVLALFGAAGAAMLAACMPGQTNATRAPGAAATTLATTAAGTAASTTGSLAAAPACVVRPALTEGPYFVDEKLNRADIRSDPGTGALKEGLPLLLTVRVSEVAASGCAALAGAQVDLWHCDAQGVYSDVGDASFSTVGQKFLRGYQLTGANGAAQFTTIYPGWYPGRTVHIHFKIRGQTAAGRRYEFTSQWFFDDRLSDQVFAGAPYAARGERGTRNASDGIYQGGGDQLVLALSPAAQGYQATFDIGLQLPA